MWTLAVAPLDLAGEGAPPRDQKQREAVNGSVVSEKFSNLCSCAVTLIQSGLYRTPFLLIDFHEHLPTAFNLNSRSKSYWIKDQLWILPDTIAPVCVLVY